MWQGVINLVNQIRLCERAGATAAAVAMAYVCIDTMAYLGMPGGRDRQTRRDFIDWVDTYLRGHEEQRYQYRGIDVYGARVAMLHGFGSVAEFHQQNPDALTFGYHDGGRHMFRPEVSERLVLIGTTSFLRDVVQAVQAFVDQCRQDRDLRARAEARLPHVLALFPVPQQPEAGGPANQR